MQKIFSEFQNKASSITADDISINLDDFFKAFQDLIDGYARKVYENDLNLLALESWREVSRTRLLEGLETFYFKKKHWEVDKTPEGLYKYLCFCLKTLSDQHFWEKSGAIKNAVLVCPACKTLGFKVVLSKEDRLWRCSNCSKEDDRISKRLKGEILPAERSLLLSKQAMHKVFALHSRVGYKCKDEKCGRFIPVSAMNKFGLQCPYPNCDFFYHFDPSVSQLKEIVLEKVAHPSTITSRNIVSLDMPLSDDNDSATLSDTLVLKDNAISADSSIEFNQDLKFHHKTMMNVINKQLLYVKNNESNKTQKILMYEAYKALAELEPEEMVSYLVHRKVSFETSIQVRLFQKYVELLENVLPISITKYGETKEIYSISDSDLGLFIGESKFNATVKFDGTIPNGTIETYTGSREFKDYGSCYIGKIVNITDLKTKESYLSKIKSYSFIQIDTDIVPGTEVEVFHYRIPPHYEMGAMVSVQRVRKSLVDKIQIMLKKGKQR